MKESIGLRRKIFNGDWLLLILLLSVAWAMSIYKEKIVKNDTYRSVHINSDATDRKFSRNRHRILFDVGLYPFHFSRKLPLKKFLKMETPFTEDLNVRMCPVSSQIVTYIQIKHLGIVLF